MRQVMEINALRLCGLLVVFPVLGSANDLLAPELVRSHGELYVNLQLCSNTYLEYRHSPRLAKHYLNASLEIQSAYISQGQLNALVDAVQNAHDRQGSIEVYAGEGREDFYKRVFSNARCERELKLAKAFRF
ncbi:hypothetical protein CPA50_16380 [Marinobacter sp. ANT_B65]|nr:hypothetical protein CPA50_16380 [Marinobacter sp. ANT_B65]